MSQPPATLAWAFNTGLKLGFKIALPIALALFLLGLALSAARGDWTQIGPLALGLAIILVTLPLAVAGVYAGIYTLLAGRR